jgi:hypothetical protein
MSVERANDLGTCPIGPLGPAVAALFGPGRADAAERRCPGCAALGPADPHAGG